MDIPIWVFYAFLLFVVLVGAFILHHIVKSSENDIEWWQFIALRGNDGVYRADITKLGQAVGILVGAWTVITLASEVKNLDALGFTAILTAYLVYTAGVATFQQYMRAKQFSKDSNVDTNKPV